jgi:hypothetical protein
LEFQPKEYKENYMKWDAEFELADAVVQKHTELFWWQPNVHEFGAGYVLDENGEETEEPGIVIKVTKKVPQEELPEKDRIPDRIDCVRIQIIEEANDKVLWSHRLLYHRPVMPGVVVAGPPDPSDDNVNLGTLTGLAVRKSDGKSVLVTNLHVLTGGYENEPTGNEELYQPESTDLNFKVARILDWVAINPRGSNSADVAIAELLPRVSANYEPHVERSSDSHSVAGEMGVVAPGTVEPTVGKVLTYVAPEAQGTIAKVKKVNRNVTVGGVRFTGVTVLDLSANRGGRGDSGAPCLVQAGHGRYKMSCIVFGGTRDGTEAYAFPASVAERELGITFGSRPPVASASASPSTVDTGRTVTLDGSRSSDPDGDRLDYRWEQEGGARVVIRNSDRVAVTFRAPSRTGELTFRLTVSDPAGNSDSDSVSIRVRARETWGVGTTPASTGAAARAVRGGSDVIATGATPNTAGYQPRNRRPGAVGRARVIPGAAVGTGRPRSRAAAAMAGLRHAGLTIRRPCLRYGGRGRIRGELVSGMV